MPRDRRTEGWDILTSFPLPEKPAWLSQLEHSHALLYLVLCSNHAWADIVSLFLN